MPIKLTPFDHSPVCIGSSWTVQDEIVLAGQIARVAIGQSRQVAKILAGARVKLLPVSQGAIEGAIKLLTVPNDKPPWHRDGWMFQIMSWIAVNRAQPGALVSAPHMIHSHKGFDGIQIEMGETANVVTAVVIFEDKATENPRQTITGDVWPDIQKMEAGDRENALAQEVTGLLTTQSAIDVDSAIETIIWKQARSYRISITVGDDHADANGRKKLFKGYDGVAPGKIERRCGEILHVGDLRPWMQKLAEKAIIAVKTLATENV
jgi:hypothetical protein